MTKFRVSWINGPDGRVIESHVFTDRTLAEDVVRAAARKVGEDELLVFEVSADGYPDLD